MVRKAKCFQKDYFFMHAIAYVKKINEYLNKIGFQTLVWLSGQFIHTTLIWLNILACFWRRTLTFEDGNFSAEMMKYCSRCSAFFHMKKYNSSEKSLFQNMQHTFEFLGWSRSLSWKIFIYLSPSPLSYFKILFSLFMFCVSVIFCFLFSSMDNIWQ